MRSNLVGGRGLHIVCAIALACWCGLVGASRPEAGELRLSYGELTALLQTFFDRRVLVACADMRPKEAAEATQRCSEIAARFVAADEAAHERAGEGVHDRSVLRLHLPVFKFDARKIGIIPNQPVIVDLDAVPIQAGGIRIVADFGSEARFAALCREGNCDSFQHLPHIVWRRGRLEADFAPRTDDLRLDELTGQGSGLTARSGEGIELPPLQLASLAIEGRFDLACPPGWFVGPLICAAMRIGLFPDVEQIAAVVERQVVASVNKVGLAALANRVFATSLAALLPMWGAERSGGLFSMIAAGPQGVRVSFCVPPGCR